MQRQRPFTLHEIGPETEPIDREDQLAGWLKEGEEELEEEDSDPSEFDEPVEQTEDEEPSQWVCQEMCVQDPFIRAKVSVRFSLSPKSNRSSILLLRT